VLDDSRTHVPGASGYCLPAGRMHVSTVVPVLRVCHLQEGDFPWRNSFCAWTMACEHPTVMVVNDAMQDFRCGMALSCCTAMHSCCCCCELQASVQVLRACRWQSSAATWLACSAILALQLP
jgi:hypothetical protein